MRTPLARRQFLALTVGAVADSLMDSRPVFAAAATSVPVQALAFDALAIFDPRPIFTLAEELFSGKRSGVEQNLANKAVRIHLASHRRRSLR